MWLLCGFRMRFWKRMCRCSAIKGLLTVFKCYEVSKRQRGEGYLKEIVFIIIASFGWFSRKPEVEYFTILKQS